MTFEYLLPLILVCVSCMAIIFMVKTLNIIVWLTLVYGRRASGLPKKVLLQEAYIPGEVKAGIFPAGVLLILIGLLGLLLLLAGYFLSLEVFDIGKALIAVPILAGCVAISAHIPTLFISPDQSQERLEERQKGYAGKINALSERIQEEGDRVSILRLCRQYWRAMYAIERMADIEMCGSQENKGNRLTVAQLYNDLHYVKGHELADKRLRNMADRAIKWLGSLTGDEASYRLCEQENPCKAIVTIYKGKTKFMVGVEIFFAPDIPKRKLRNALNSYALDVNPEDVLVLLDTTFISDKDGALVTDKRIYGHNTGEPSQMYELDSVESVEIVSKGGCHILSINNKTFLKSNGLCKGMVLFAQMLKEISCKPSKQATADDQTAAANDQTLEDENTVCLECGTVIPMSLTKCPSCGWSYMEP